MIHRVIMPDEEYPKEYAILVTNNQSVFIRQPKTRSSFALRGEMKWGTALVTDVVPRTLQDYEKTNLGMLAREPSNLAVPHESVISLAVNADKPILRRRDFLVKWTMQRQKEIFQVYNFDMSYHDIVGQAVQIRFYAVPLGAYFKPRRQTKTRETILREYAQGIFENFRRVLPDRILTGSARLTEA